MTATKNNAPPRLHCVHVSVLGLELFFVSLFLLVVVPVLCSVFLLVVVSVFRFLVLCSCSAWVVTIGVLHFLVITCVLSCCQAWYTEKTSAADDVV